MTRNEAIEFLELTRTMLVDEDSSIYSKEIWEALGMAIDELSREVAYICDEKCCAKGCYNPDCHHTCDIDHAKNFVEVETNKWMERA